MKFAKESLNQKRKERCEKKSQEGQKERADTEM